MPVALAKDVIDAASTIPTVEVIAFSGGEPFLYPKMLKELVGHAGRLGLASAVVTNSSWALSRVRAWQTLAELVELGLSDFTTSVDWFHLQFAKADRLRNAVHAALDLNLFVHVNVVVSRNGNVTVHDACRLLELPTERLMSCNEARRGAVELKELSPVRVGAAFDHLKDADLIRFDRRLLAAHPCPLVVENPVVNPLGEVYGCCGFGGGSDQGPSLLTRIGRLDSSGFLELMERMQGDLLLNLFHRYGPYRVIELTLERHAELRTRSSYVFSCEVCHEIVRRADLQEAVAMTLDELAGAELAGT